MTQFEYLDNGGLPIASAHRGGALEAERAGLHESSIPAFRHVVDMGYRYLETDVRATAAGEVYAWHGQGLFERMNKRKPLNKRDIESIRINGERVISLLDELLEEFPDSRFAIDPKHWPAVEPLAETIITTKAFDRVSVGAFSQRRAELVARTIFEKTGVEICTGMGIRGVAEVARQAYGTLSALGTPAPGATGESGATDWQARSPIANLSRSTSTAPMIEAAHRGDAKVITWTVNDADEMGRFLDLGVDGIHTDEPSILKGVLQDRGLWR